MCTTMHRPPAVQQSPVYLRGVTTVEHYTCHVVHTRQSCIGLQHRSHMLLGVTPQHLNVQRVANLKVVGGGGAGRQPASQRHTGSSV